jgi:non-ribosomal peptide synthetase component F
MKARWRASVYSAVLPETLVASIETLSRSRGSTLFTIIITALNILLFKARGEREIIVMATIGNRSMPELEPMLGCFINDVILRSEVDGSQTGLALLDRVKQTVGEAIHNKEVPLQKVLEAVKSKRELTVSASVTLEPPVHGFDRLPEWEFAPVPPQGVLWDEETSLNIYVSSPAENYKIVCIRAYYSADLFAEETIARLF